jgi:hypothetical protein
MFALAYAPIESLRTQKQAAQAVIPLIRFGFLWILIGFIPPALGMDGIPHANRALLALPGFIIITCCGAHIAVQSIQKSQLNQKMLGSHKETDIFLKAIIGMWMLLHTVFFLSYIHNYYTNYRVNSSGAYQSGYRELMNVIKTLEAERGWDKILISSAYGQPYIYTLLFHSYSPYSYHGGVLINYEFAPIKVGDLNRTKAIIVATPEDREALELPQPPDITVYDTAGVPRFWVYVRP